MVATTVSRRLVARPREGLAQRDRGSLRFPSSAALYICVGRFGPHAAACIEAHLACIPNPRAAEHPCWSIRFRCLLFPSPCPQEGYLQQPPPGKGGRSASPLSIPGTRRFRSRYTALPGWCMMVRGRSGPPSNGCVHLCRVVEAPGDPRAGLLGPSGAFWVESPLHRPLNTRPGLLERACM